MEATVLAGVVPLLLNEAQQEDGPCERLALSVIFSIATGTASGRRELTKLQGLEFIMSFLDHMDRTNSVLEIVVLWLIDDATYVEEVLCREQNANRIISAFEGINETNAGHMMEPFFRLFHVSPKICAQLAQFDKGRFINVATAKFRRHPDNNTIRLYVLKTLAAIDEAHETDSDLFDRHHIDILLEFTGKQQDSVVVSKLARRLYSKVALRRVLQSEVLPSVVELLARDARDPNTSSAATTYRFRRIDSLI